MSDPPQPSANPELESLQGFVAVLGFVVSTLAGGAATQVAPPNDQPGLSWTIHLIVAAACFGWAGFCSVAPGSARSDQRKMLATTLWASLVAVPLLVGYLWVRGDWTVPYGEGRVVVGSVLTDDGALILEDAGLTAEEAVDEAAGDAEAIWTPESIAERERVLWLLYVPSFAAASFLLLVAWGWYRARSQDPRAP